MTKSIYTVSQKNDTDVAHYNFNTHQPIEVIWIMIINNEMTKGSFTVYELS